MKNKILLFPFVFLIVLCSFVISLIYFFHDDNIYEPPRLYNIPQKAIWRGAQDEGFWIEALEIDSIKKIINLKIYNDYNGELVLFAGFAPETNCKILPFDKENILNNIIAFSSKTGIENRDEIIMKNNCSLKLVKPAYGGSFWQLESEK